MTPLEGGGEFSRVWEDAGGTAIRYDVRLDVRHDLMVDDAFWAAEYAEPADLYMFAPPCTTLTIAHTTPVIRSTDNPYGWTDEARSANKLVVLMIRRALMLISLGAAVIIENPLLSYMWLLQEVAGLGGMPGTYLTRIDQCMTAGTPYQKGQVWFSTVLALTGAGSVCCHKEKHQQLLSGGCNARRTAPYPRELAVAVVESVVANLRDTGRMGDPAATKAAGEYLDSITGSEPKRRSKNKTQELGFCMKGEYLDWIKQGLARISHLTICVMETCLVRVWMRQ